MIRGEPGGEPGALQEPSGGDERGEGVEPAGPTSPQIAVERRLQFVVVHAQGRHERQQVHPGRQVADDRRAPATQTLGLRSDDGIALVELRADAEEVAQHTDAGVAKGSRGRGGQRRHWRLLQQNRGGQVVGVEAANRVEDQRGVGRRPGMDTDAVLRERHRHHAGAADQAARWHETDKTCVRGGTARGDAGLGRQADGGEAGGDGHRGAATRPARAAREVERIEDLAAERAEPAGVEREFVHVRLQQDYGAGVAQPSNHGGVVRRRQAVEAETAAGGGQAGDVDVVLHRDRDAVQRAAPAARPSLVVEGAREVECLRIDSTDGVQARALRVVSGDACEIQMREPRVGQRPTIDGLLDLGDRRRPQIDGALLRPRPSDRQPGDGCDGDHRGAHATRKAVQQAVHHTQVGIGFCGRAPLAGPFGRLIALEGPGVVPGRGGG